MKKIFLGLTIAALSLISLDASAATSVSATMPETQEMSVAAADDQPEEVVIIIIIIVQD